MKKYLSALLALMLVLTGCQVAKNPDTTHESSQLPSVTTAPTEESTAPTEESTAPTEPELVTVQRIQKIAYLQPWGWDSEHCWVRSYDYAEGKLSTMEAGQLRCEETFHPGTAKVATVIWYDYDRESTVTSVSEFDETGLLIRETDSTGYTTTYVYNTAGQLLEEVAFDSAGEELERQTWSYNEKGDQLAHFRFEGDTEIAREIWVYDDRGHLVEMTEYDHDQMVNHGTWVYDASGNLLERCFEYASMEYDSYDYEDIYASYDSYTYDEAGNLLESYHEGDDLSNSWCYRVTYTYDQDHTRTETHNHLDYAGQTVEQDIYIYDANENLLYSLTHYEMDGAYVEIYQCTYDDAGRITENKFTMECDGELFWDTRNTYAYHHSGSLQEHVIYESEQEISRLKWEFSPEGLVLGQQFYEEGVLTYSFSCQYDEAGALVDVKSSSFLSLREEGDRVLAMEDSLGDPFYVAITYETLTVSPAEAEILEAINDYILLGL